MIISASRRTDIPAHFGDWFLNRLRDGFLYVRNPMNPHQVSKILLSPEKIECIVFWTKNPSDKFIDNLEQINKLGYSYYFQYTITAYNKSVEVNIPRKEIQINRFLKLSDLIGAEKVIWRYDPIFFTEYYNMAYHRKWFDYLASRLNEHTEKCVISFLDCYPKIKNRLISHGITEVNEEQMKDISFHLAEIAKKYSLKLESCCENIDLSSVGIEHGHCIDPDLIARIKNKQYIFKKDKTQRQDCGCIESIDVGGYNTCLNKCIYCYANWSDTVVTDYDPESPILCSHINSDDKITERVIKSCEILQPELL